MEITKALSEYLVNLKFSDLPSDVVEGAKLCFLDWLGVTLSGSKESLTGILLQLAETQGGAPQATVIGKKKKTSLLQAALINGSASHALDSKVPETCTTSCAQIPLTHNCLPTILLIPKSGFLSERPPKDTR